MTAQGSNPRGQVTFSLNRGAGIFKQVGNAHINI